MIGDVEKAEAGYRWCIDTCRALTSPDDDTRALLGWSCERFGVLSTASIAHPRPARTCSRPWLFLGQWIPATSLALPSSSQPCQAPIFIQATQKRPRAPRGKHLILPSLRETSLLTFTSLILPQSSRVRREPVSTGLRQKCCEPR